MKRCCESQEGSPESRKEAIGVKRAHRIEGVGKGGGGNGEREPARINLA